MWLHPEPADERIVVSEMGEQWSPEDGARERCGERDDGEARIDGLDNRHHDRDQDAKRAPRPCP